MAFHNLTTADGLISNQVSAIYRDSRGFLWVGTEEGLDRYDAYRFCSFTAQDGVPGLRISSLAEDTQGRIWVMTSDGSACYSYQDDRFVPAEEALSAMGIRIREPVAVGSNPDHSVFWVLGEESIAAYSVIQDRVLEFPVSNTRYLLPSMQEDRIYYAESDARLFCADMRTGVREEISYPESFRSQVAGLLPRLYADKRGGLWVYTYRTDILLHYTPAETLPKNEGQFNRITAIAEDSSGNVWVTTSHDGLFLFRTDGSRQQMTHDPDKLFSLPGDNLVALHIDRDDIVWVGNFKLGLSSYAPRSLTLMHFNVIGTNDILSFCETPDALYLGTDGSGLFRSDRFDGTFTPVPTGVTVINCITRDSRGDLWLGSWESGLVRLGPDGRKKAVYTSRNSDLHSNSIFSIREGPDGGIYVGLYLGAVQRLDPDTGDITTVFSDSNVTVHDLVFLNDGTLVVGYSESAKGFINRVRMNPSWEYQILGILDDVHPVGEALENNVPVLGKLSALSSILSANEVEEVFVTLKLQDYQKLDDVVNACEKAGVMVKLIPDYGPLIPSKPYTEDLQGLPVIHVRRVPLNDSVNAFLKRTVDIIGSLFAIILFSPLMLVTAILVKTTKGPVIYKQERVGLHNRNFMMYKFRSMVVQDVKDEKNEWTKKGDARVTPVGKFIRKTSIDELPQLFNVLSGKMSLIGPRPERPQFVQKFEEEIPRYRVKHQVRPGMTGWAQVNGLRGDTSIEERIRYDIYYIENWTFWFDIKILFLTFFKGFVNKNAY